MTYFAACCDEAQGDTLRAVAVSRPGLSPVMVGRSDELRRLLTLLPDRSGSVTTGPQIALVAGEAGIGKSRLLAELRAAIPATTPIIVGQAGAGPPGRPYSVLLDALAPLVRAWSSVPHRLAGRDEPVRALLSSVAPSLVTEERDYAPDELMRAAVDVVVHLAPPPAVVVFEDLHEADPESITLFGRLALTADFGALLVGTYRQEDLGVGHPLALTVTDLERRRGVLRLSLGRLSRPAVGEFLAVVYGGPVPWHVVDAVHRRTAGNPFFVEELLIAAGDNDVEQLTSTVLPWNVVDEVLRRLSDLDEVGRAVIDAAAVLGTRFSFELLLAVADMEAPELVSVLRRLVKSRLLVEEAADVFSFRHALTREAIAGELLGREQRLLHARALAAMQALGSDDYAGLAHHAAGAGQNDQVGEFARQGSAAYLRLGLVHEALRLAQNGLAEDDNDPELRRIASQAAWTIGLADVARRHGQEWRRLAAVDADFSAEGAALRHLARVEWEAGNPPAGISYAEQALALAERHGPSEDLALAMAGVSEARMLTVVQTPAPHPGDVNGAAEAVSWADQALALAEQIDRDDIRPRALVSKGTALTEMPGRIAEGMAVLEQARREAADQGDAWNHMRTVRNMTDVGLLIWPPARIQAALDDQRQVACEIGREGHADPSWAQAAANLAIVRGELAEARHHLAEGRRLTPVLHGFERWGYADLEIALALEAGELADATSLLASAEEADDNVHWNGSFDCRAAELAALEGDLVRAAERLMRAIDGPGAGSTSLYRRPPLMAAAITLLRCGAGPGIVREAVDSLNGTWPAFPDAPLGLAWHVEGALLEAQHRPGKALAAYVEALADPFGHRPAHLIADAHQGVARCLLATDRADQARVHAGRAINLLKHWPGWRTAAADALGRRTRPTTRTPAGALTTREREVAALLTEGLTNGEVALRLFISTKTASVHVSNILAKLDMKSRAEIAAWAARQQLLASATDGPAARQ